MMMQQGDVIIEAVDAMPVGVTVSPEGRGYVLAKGEATGHSHTIEDIEGVEMVEKDGAFYIRIDREKTVTHEEHNPVIIQPGVYRVRKVREWDHFAEEARAVAD